MKLNKMDPYIFGVKAEQDREKIFNSRLNIATDEAREKGMKEEKN